MRLYLPLLPALLLLSGCTTLQQMRATPPSVTMQSATVPSVSQTGFDLKLDGLVKNPNGVSLPLNTIDYTLFLNDKQILDSVATLEGSVPAHGEEAIMVNVPVTWKNLEAVREAVMQMDGQLPYRMEGRMAVKGIPMVESVPVSYSGTLDVKDLAKRAAKYALQSAELRSLVQDLAPEAMSTLRGMF